MTDNEIIQALECCSDDENYKCNECPLYVDCEKASITEYALGIINRQKAEIERLQKENEELGKAIGNAYELNCFLEATRKCVRTEAYREFAEKLRTTNSTVENELNKLLSNDMGRYDHYTDSFVKETVESNE